MTLSGNLPDVIARQQTHNGLSILPVKAEHIYGLSDIGDHHRDPFDRLLVAQARQENLSLVTADAKVQDYNVTLLW
jgi:PIN domain nuclease of toxin-antitoxin system